MTVAMFAVIAVALILAGGSVLTGRRSEKRADMMILAAYVLLAAALGMAVCP